MVLECVMLVLDNSSYSINGDYHPTRLAAQADAVHIIFNQKCNSNPESEVGLMMMGGKSPEVLVTPTQDEGKLIAALHECKQGGEADLNTGIQVAQLALKHRQNKNQRQRIIVFVGSPISASTATLIKLGKKMKKNNVAIDIVSFGTGDFDPASLAPLTASSSTDIALDAPETNASKLQALHEAVNSSDNSHFITVEPGPHLLSDRISNSAILRGEGEDGNAGGGDAGGGAFGEIDANLDPELAMALRMSLDEERARQAAVASAATMSEAPLASVPEVKKEETDESMDTSANLDEDEELKRALAMSSGDVEMGDEEEDEDAALARALALSVKEEEE